MVASVGNLSHSEYARYTLCRWLLRIPDDNIIPTFQVISETSCSSVFELLAVWKYEYMSGMCRCYEGFETKNCINKYLCPVGK
jgi:hypothetical protein